jgi:predicted PurR-regulated permease PerM
VSNASNDLTRAFWLAAASVVGFFLLWQIRSVAILVAFAVLLAYVLDPVVNAIERVRFPRDFRLPRPAAAAAIVLAIVIGGVWLASWGIPRLVSEVSSFVQRVPANLESVLLELRVWAERQGMRDYMDPALEGLRASLSDALQNLGGAVVGGAGRVFGTIGQILGVAVVPLLAYYLLAEREEVNHSIMRFVPETEQKRFREILAATDRALKSYVRGQAVVSLVMGTAVGLALAILGFPAVMLLGVMVAIAEVLPYVGFLIAAVAIALTGYGIDPLHAVMGVAVYTVLNTVIGMVVTPRVMGRHLKMHPFVITVSILAGAQLLGPPGAMLALPAAAVIQALVERFAPRGPQTAKAARASR